MYTSSNPAGFLPFSHPPLSHPRSGHRQRAACTLSSESGTTCTRNQPKINSQRWLCSFRTLACDPGCRQNLNARPVALFIFLALLLTDTVLIASCWLKPLHAEHKSARLCSSSNVSDQQAMPTSYVWVLKTVCSLILKIKQEEDGSDPCCSPVDVQGE